jgi:hypothetical protein
MSVPLTGGAESNGLLCFLYNSVSSNPIGPIFSHQNRHSILYKNMCKRFLSTTKRRSSKTKKRGPKIFKFQTHNALTFGICFDNLYAGSNCGRNIFWHFKIHSFRYPWKYFLWKWSSSIKSIFSENSFKTP